MQITYTLANGQAASITPDACVEEGHNGEADVTEDPVESGAPISDHTRAKNDAVTLQIVVSNSPLTQPPDNMGGVTSAVQAVQLTPTQSANLLTFSGNFDRVGAVFEELHRLKNEGVICGVTLSLKTYDSMVLRSIDARRSAMQGNALYATLGFKRVRIAQTQTAPVPSVPRARSSAARGRQTAQAQPGQPASQANASFWSRTTGQGIAVIP